MKFWLIVILAVVGVLLAALAWFMSRPSPGVAIANFDQCAAAGYPVMESYPAQCRTTSGQLFVQDIGNELDLSDLIQVTAPRPTQVITSPLTITGQARGPWFFEAQFSGRLLDAQDHELGVVILTADGDWMTEDFVPFSGTLDFPTPIGQTGTLILDKANASGLPEHANNLSIPVKFQ